MYVKEKRHRLFDAGYRDMHVIYGRSWLVNGDYHVVLEVETRGNAYVLDNLSNTITSRPQMVIINDDYFLY